MHQRHSCSIPVLEPGLTNYARHSDLPRAILPDLIEPGSELGPLRSSVAEEVGLNCRVTVIAPATHDTASAVVAVPAKNQPVSRMVHWTGVILARAPGHSWVLKFRACD